MLVHKVKDIRAIETPWPNSSFYISFCKLKCQIVLEEKINLFKIDITLYALLNTCFSVNRSQFEKIDEYFSTPVFAVISQRKP